MQQATRDKMNFEGESLSYNSLGLVLPLGHWNTGEKSAWQQKMVKAGGTSQSKYNAEIKAFKMHGHADACLRKIF